MHWWCPGAETARRTSRQLRRHSIKANQPVHAADYHPRPLNSAGTLEPRFMTTSGARSLDETQRLDALRGRYCPEGISLSGIDRANGLQG